MRKELLEKRNEAVNKMQNILDTAKADNRALTPDEREKFDILESQVKDIDATANLEDAMQNYAPVPIPAENKTQEQKDIEAFDKFIRTGVLNATSDSPFKTGDNGAIIPSSIAQKIIDKVVEICPIFSLSTKYNIAGTLNIPYYDAESGDITMEYCEEFTDGVATSGKFKSIQLTGFLARAIADIPKRLINKSQFDVVNFVINKMAQNIAKFIEKELLVGTSGKVEGLSTVTQTVTAKSATAVTADELMDLQDCVPDVYQPNAVFIMNRATRNAIRKLKDNDGNYLLNRDISSKWGYTLLGKDVYTSDNMPKMVAGACAIYYGDMSGLAVKISEDINIDVLTEVKARQHAVEVLGFVEIDAKVENGEKIAKLVMKSGT